MTAARRDPLRADRVIPFLMSVIASGEQLTEDDRADIRAALAESPRFRANDERRWAEAERIGVSTAGYRAAVLATRGRS